ncbi:MAG: Cache 3/Cache 2 fusion domain-containing protein [Desulfatitalea sp.]
MTIKKHIVSKSLKHLLDPLRNLRLNAKVALIGANSVLTTAVALVILAVWQSGQYDQLAQGKVDLLINADLEHITQSVYNLVQTENEAVQLQVDYNLNVARHLLAGAGKASLSKDTTAWTATNQFTKVSARLHLPRLLVGDTWLGKNTDLETVTPIVDEVTRLVGETATIFQRMNARGDMLRVATTVKTVANERAIGTYIPAVNPDGKQNPVIAAILEGKTYHGRAYVVEAWYLTAYEPILDSAGDLVGMLYVGIQQKVVESRVKQAILQTEVGKTGYVYVLGSKEEDRGRYIISYKGERDGEDIWSSTDSDGRYVIQEVIGKATLLKPGEMTTVRYRWQNPGEPEPRWKVVCLAYYAPWDWVIGTSVHEDELQAYRNLLSDGRLRMIRVMGLAGIVITVLVGMIGILITWTITRPVHHMTEVAKKIIGGDLNQVVQVESHDEIGVLARTFNLMTRQLKLSMEGLRKSEEKYRGIFENALEGLFQITTEGRILSSNPAMAHILGYASSEELISSGTDVRRQVYVDPSDADRLVAIISEHREAFGFEVQLYRKDKVKIWVSVSARMVCGDAGDFIEGSVTDISDRTHAQEDLAESKNFLDEIINAVADPMFVKDRHHRWVLVNNAMCTFTGHARDELLGKSEYDYFSKHEADVFWSKDELVLTSGMENINEESFTDAQGVAHTIVTKKTLYTDKKGDHFIVGIIRDITEQKQAEEEKIRLEARLTHSQKMEAIGALAGGIAHDFNNILQPMLGYSELLRQDLPADSQQRRYVDGIYYSGMRAKDLVNQILAFSRQSEHKTTPVRIQTILREVVKLSRSTIPSNIEISQEIQKECGCVVADPTQLHQIAMNLMINAYHATEKTGGEITIRLRETKLDKDALADTLLRPGRYAMLSVADTGCGIDPAIMDKIFEPYFTTKAQGKGTGLGLSVVYGIVKAHHGDIKVFSEAGKGTTIDIYLPLTDDYTGAASPERIEDYPTGRERILLIDDEEMIAELEKHLFERLGYQVTVRLSSVDALEAFRANPDAYDLVITDMSMPNMTGEQLAKELIAINPGIPIIMCTGFSERIGRERAKSIGIKEFLMKPITISEMSQMVRKVLDESLSVTEG